MVELLSRLLGLAVPVFAVASMLSVGLSYTPKQILEPLRHVRGVALALAANFVVVPLLAYAISRLLTLDRSLELGLVLIALAAGAPFAVKLVEIARGDVPFTAGLLVLMLLATIVYMPVVVPLAVPDVTIGAGAIARPLLLTMLLPLGLGVALRGLAPSWGARLQPLAAKTANVSLVLLVILTVVVNVRAIVGVFGTGAILAALLVLGGALASGYLLGGFRPDTRDEMALVTSQRNFAAALVVAQSFADEEVLVMVVVVSVVSMLLLFPIARAMGRHVERSSAESAGAASDAPGEESGRNAPPGRRRAAS
ncbi:MAG: bile acid:sodium symporter family protein [Armatimonadota bacterium]